jgi:hypothetical protein
VSIDVEIVAKLAKFEAEMKKLGPLSDAQTKKAAAEILRNLTKAERDSAKNAKQVAKAWEDAGKKVREALGEKLSPTFQKLAGLSDALGVATGANTTKLLALGAGAAGVGLVIAGLATGTAKLAAHVQETTRNYEDLADGLTATDRDALHPHLLALEEARDAIVRADQASAAFSLTLAGIMAPATVEANDALTGLYKAATDAASAFNLPAMEEGGLGWTLLNLTGVGTAAKAALIAVDELAQYGAAQSGGGRTIVADDVLAGLIGMPAASSGPVSAPKAAARTARAAVSSPGASSGPSWITPSGTGPEVQASAAALAVVMERIEATKELTAAVDALNRQNLDGVDAVNAKYDLELQRIDELAEKLGETEDVKAAYHLLDMQRAEELAAVQREAFAENLQLAQGYLQSAGTFAGAISDLVIGVHENQIDAAARGSDAEKKARLKAFKAAKAAGIATAAINTAIAVTQALAGSPPPMNYINAALAGAAGAVQIGLIAAKQPPSMHRGGMVGSSSWAPDEVGIRAQAGEAVLNRSAVDAIGGPTGVNAINMGMGLGPGMIAVVPMFDHRAFDPFVTRDLRRASGALRSAVRGGRLAGLRLPGGR